MKIVVLNTGGTFNKRYNPINGELEVPTDSKALERIVNICHNIDFEIKNIISKDSLEFTNEDRELICSEIKNSQKDKFIIIHGTDTMHLTAKFLDENIKDKKIVLTGAMIPMSIDEVEATINFSQAVGFLNNIDLENKIFVSMHGIVCKFDEIAKNREIGVFKTLK